MSGWRSIAQPGPVAPDRIVAVATRLRPLQLDMPRGMTLLQGIATQVKALGLDSAVFRFSGAFDPFAWVMPARAPDNRHAAWYSDVFRADAPVRVLAGALTFGTRDGQPFYHAHGIWRLAGGALAAGHLLPDVVTSAADVTLTGVGLCDARFAVVPDPETGFSLFEPQALRVPPHCDGWALRLRPDQDITRALVQVASARGIVRARLQGGVGSLVGARFSDGAPPVPGFATEMFVDEALITPGVSSRVAAHVVDLDGRIGHGVLAEGCNPVLMTLEAVLEDLGPVAG